ncbi:hypothetical protein GCM10022291_30350 [Postechiella marina]|uniref:Uncharacterized protein n=1 Tax=Postechiella marina TaxID=943941 RepID=A0ABP8CGC1_9FLAO
MIKLNKHIPKRNLTPLLMLSCMFLFLSVYAKTKFKLETLNYFQKKDSININYPNSSLNTLHLLYEASIKNADTIQAINSLRELSAMYSHQGNHKKSYDYLWEALLLADNTNYKQAQSLIYKDIGRHYSYYNRRDKALKFLSTSLNLKKDLVKKGELDKGLLTTSYVAFTSTYRELKEWELNRKYIDSSKQFITNATTAQTKHYIQFEDAVATNISGNHKAALIKYNKIIPWFIENNPSYLVLLYNYIGDTYNDLGNFKESESYYKKALKTSASLNAHIDFTPLIHERLSKLYYSRGDYKSAFKNLKKGKALDAVFFDSRSEINSPLLEIQDAFLKEKKSQSEQAQQLRLKQLEQDENVLFLQKTILSAFIIILILFGLIYLSFVRSKHRAEKEVIKRKRELETQKNKEIIELKNKELATSVLKLIEKDAFIETLKNKLSKGTGHIDRQEAKQIILSISNNSTDNWNEFEARFVAINKSFYNRLQTEFPKLTLNDQRLCALVKLNFSSKDIARLLNMSTDSVHTTRSRLRKKLELDRNINLKQFIANI